MNLPPGYYYRPPDIGLDSLSASGKLFVREWVSWTLAILIWGIVDTIAYVAATIPTGVWGMLAYAYGHGFDPSATNGDGSWPPYHNLWQEVGGSFLLHLIGYTAWLISLAGLARMGLRQLRGEPLTAFDAFRIRRRLPWLIGLSVVTYVPFVVSINLCLVPGLVLAGLWMFAPVLMVDDDAGVWQSLRRSAALVRGNLVAAALFVLADILYAGLGSIALILGMIVTSAQAMIALVIVYDRCKNTIVPIPGYAQVVPGMWPPPSGSPAVAEDLAQPSSDEPPTDLR